MELLDKLAWGVFPVLALFIPALIVILWWRRRRQRYEPELPNVASEGENDIVGTESDLRAAEAEITKSDMEIRRELLKRHELYDRYSTLQGFTETYMNDFLAELRGKGIECETVFQETMLMGVAMAIVHRQGIFELYIRRDQLKEADRIIRARIQPR